MLCFHRQIQTSRDARLPAESQSVGRRSDVKLCVQSVTLIVGVLQCLFWVVQNIVLIKPAKKIY